MLDEFQAVVKKVEKQEAEIRDEYEEMGEMQDALIAQAGRSIYSGCGKRGRDQRAGQPA